MYSGMYAVIMCSATYMCGAWRVIIGRGGVQRVTKGWMDETSTFMKQCNFWCSSYRGSKDIKKPLGG